MLSPFYVSHIPQTAFESNRIVGFLTLVLTTTRGMVCIDDFFRYCKIALFCSLFLPGPFSFSGNNFHNGDGYVRKELTPRHVPTLGEYDDTRHEVIAQHLQWSRQANIGLWVTSWWGPNLREDTTTRNVILPHADLGDMKVAIHYETAGRVRFGLTGISSDMEHMCDHYFDHPNYYKVNGRPVVFVYVTRKLEQDGNLEPTILTMRTSASKCGHDVYLVGDHVFDSAFSSAC